MNTQSKLLIGLLSILFILYAENFALSQETKSVPKDQQAVKANLLTHEQIISEAQRGVDRSLTVLNYTIEAIGVLVGLLTLIILVLGGLAAFFGIKEYRSWKKIRDEFQEKIKDAQEKVEQQAKGAKTDADKIKDILGKYETKYKEAEVTLNKIKPHADKIAKYEEDTKGIKEEYEKKFRDLSITEKPSEETKEKLDELAEKSAFLEGVGVELEADDYFNRGLDYGYKGEYEEALKSYDKAIELNPDDALAWSNKGAALDNLGKHEEAIKSYDKAIKINPDNEIVWSNKGIALHKLGKYEEAVKPFDKALELEPDYVDAWYNKGCTLHKLGEYEEAIKSAGFN